MLNYIGKGHPFERKDGETNQGEGETDLSYLSQWQASLPDDIGRDDNSMSYDKDVLNQRSDPTWNQIDNEYSLKQMFFPSEMDPQEEEKRFSDLRNNMKSADVFDMTGDSLRVSKNLESEFVSSANSIGQKFNPNTPLNDLLSFEDVSKDESRSAMIKSANLLDELNRNGGDIGQFINKNKTINEKDELIENLLWVVKNLGAKIKDLESTSRANSAMLDNIIKKKQDFNKKVHQNAEGLLLRFKKQNEYLDNLSDLNLSTEGSNEDSEDEESKRINQKDHNSSRAKTACSECSIQTEPKPSAFPFGCQTNFANANELKIKELQELLIKQEEEFENKLEEARKMDDVEDAFQAFLDQLDLNENEERIIIDGESRVWKIIRCSKSIIEDEWLEDEEEEEEEEKPTATNSDATSSKKAEMNDELKEQIRNRDRPTNPMRKLDSPDKEGAESNKKANDEQKQASPSENKEGILIVEDNAQDSDSNDASHIKEELEGSIGDSKSGRKSQDPDQEELIKFASDDVENIEKSDDSQELAYEEMKEKVRNENQYQKSGEPKEKSKCMKFKLNTNIKIICWV